MKRTNISLMIAVLLFGLPLRARAAPPVESAGTPNAALVYWQAFATMPQWVGSKVGRRVDDATTYQGIDKPVDEELRKFLEQWASQYSLRMLHRAAEIDRCDWGLDRRRDGMELVLPHLGNALLLRRVSLLRARDHFEHGRHVEGIDDVIATIILGRHVGRDGASLVSSYSIDNLADFVVAAYLPRMPAESLDYLARRLARLPAPTSLSQTVANEPSRLDWFVAQYEKAGPKRRLELCRTLTNSDEKAKILASADVLKLAADLRPLFADIPRLIALPLDELDSVVKSQIDPRLRSNPLGEWLFPCDLPLWRRLEAVNHCQDLLLKAAVDVARRGPAALKDHPDPFGKGPFAYAAYDGGFELWSQLELPSLPGKHAALRAGIRPGHGRPEGPQSPDSRSLLPARKVKSPLSGGFVLPALTPG